MVSDTDTDHGSDTSDQEIKKSVTDKKTNNTKNIKVRAGRAGTDDRKPTKTRLSPSILTAAPSPVPTLSSMLMTTSKSHP